jgi:hypothetical protein
MNLGKKIIPFLKPLPRPKRKSTMIQSFLLFWVYPFFIFIKRFFPFRVLQNNTKHVVSKQVTITEEYCSREKTRFLSLVQNSKTIEPGFYAKENSKTIEPGFYDSEYYLSLSKNIDPIFYYQEAYLDLSKEKDNFFDKKWRANVLIESTPQGNILMFYDSFKKGFSYCSDTQVHSYDLLNAVAMKYVRIFSCLDFFMDENVVPKEVMKRLAPLHPDFEESKKKAVSDSEPVWRNPAKDDAAPFAKLRNYKLEAILQQDKKESNKKYSLQITYLNRFLYLGKWNNFSFLQSVPKKRHIPVIVNSVFNEVFEETTKNDYKEFKNRYKNKS